MENIELEVLPEYKCLYEFYGVLELTIKRWAKYLECVRNLAQHLGETFASYKCIVKLLHDFFFEKSSLVLVGTYLTFVVGDLLCCREDVDIIFPVYSGRCKVPSIHSLYESLQRKQVEDKLCKKKEDLKRLIESTNLFMDRIEYVKTNIRVYHERLSECKERKAAIEGERKKYNELMQKT